MDERPPLVVVVSGPGGVGKGTIVDELAARDPSIWLSRSWTTRGRRPGEDDDAYVFVDRATFESRAADGGFLEWAEFLGNLYGTPVPDPPPDRDVVLLEIEVQGARQVRERVPGALLVFVDAPSRAEQAERLRGRGDPEEDVQRRLREAEVESSQAEDLAMIRVVNDSVERAVGELQALVDQHRDRS